MCPIVLLRLQHQYMALTFHLKLRQKAIASLEGIPGRMERIDMGQDFTAIVDFAHTPNALKSALEAARGMLNEGRGQG